MDFFQNHTEKKNYFLHRNCYFYNYKETAGNMN